MRKIPDVFQMGDILKTPLKVIKNKEHLTNCPSHRELKELCLLSVLWYVGWDAGKKSPLGVENCCPHQNQHRFWWNVYTTFTHNYQSLEATEMSFRRQMDK